MDPAALDNQEHQGDQSSSPVPQANSGSGSSAGGASYVVAQGESIPSIAKDRGFFWRTLWNHPENAALRQKRNDPNILYAGDVVFLPDLRVKQEPGATEARHRFARKGEPVPFRLRLLFMDEPRANEDYVLEIDGRLIQGTTDADGRLEVRVPGNVDGGKLILKGGQEVYPVRIGHLDPIDEVSGVQQRLNNLGFACGSVDGQAGEPMQAALREFQAKYELEVTGEADKATRRKLQELHP